MKMAAEPVVYFFSYILVYTRLYAFILRFSECIFMVKNILLMPGFDGYSKVQCRRPQKICSQCTLVLSSSYAVGAMDYQ